MRNAETGAPHTAHTTNVVPFIMSGDGKKGPLKFADEEVSGKSGYVAEESASAEEEKKEEEKAEKGEKKTEEDEEEEAGALCDVAPTILDLMGIEKPEEMSGRSLLAH
jgi:2,3-bisphosphoglycerate-independent phosphoglycerate mutase